jgi:hypothetical protein
LISSNGKLLGNGFQATDCYWDYDWPIIVFWLNFWIICVWEGVKYYVCDLKVLCFWILC